ncbi:hypothetical protein [Glutamicibacter sp.]|uniref:hypothetical protein n=1 Tax=Glutamicibacter sp. TaxID=1931995 RepID=UPI002B47A651|nr:hypothetical protein [Glutamicibacter sp.]HJX78117.1 hypothetical protein [Glutamicibacter sp.]
MKMKKFISLSVVLISLSALTGCADGDAWQDGPLAFGVSEGTVDNTFCGVFQRGEGKTGAADIATNVSEAPLWITTVQAISTNQWEPGNSLASMLPEGNTGLYGWVNEDLEDPETRQIVDSLKPLNEPLEVPANKNVLVALEGTPEVGEKPAEISQLQISYKTDPNSPKIFTVVGNIRYEWNSNTCE